MTYINLPRHRAKRHGMCKTCLWHWPELNGEDKFLCYNRESAYYHQEFVPGCRMWERKATIVGKKVNWGDPPKQKYMKSTSGYGKRGE